MREGGAVKFQMLWVVGLILWLSALTAQAAEPPRPRPCAMPELNGDEVLQALRQLAKPVALLPASPSRWTALFPQQVGLTLTDGERASLGWTESLTGSTDRWTQYAAWSVSVRFSWELKELFRPAPSVVQPTPEQRLQWALHTESLAQRLSQSLRQLRKAQALAATTAHGDPLCSEAQADAEAALLVLIAVQSTARSPSVVGR